MLTVPEQRAFEDALRADQPVRRSLMPCERSWIRLVRVAPSY